ncbi:DUF4232 domain-containing protein [Nocardioides sp. NPDC058538]|uniref:DUF4232 domain-containing protein n=1 Tax=Nocardioides sp. NPDC058538 TaxID=3346542 RepID=UPI003665A967
MPGSTRKRELRVGIVVVGLVLLIAAGCAVVMFWARPFVSAAGTTTPEGVSRFLDLSDEWRSVPGVREVLAVDESRRIPGEDFGEADRVEHAVSIEVSLEEDLSGAEAAAASREVLRVVSPEITRLAPEAEPERTSVTFTIGRARVTVGERGLNPGDAMGDALADAVALCEAGATSVSSTVTDPQTGRPAKADVEAPQARLVALAAVARARQRPVDLRGGDAWYRSNEVPDPTAVRLVVAASEQPSVTSAQLAAPYEPLIVLVEAAEGDRVIGDVSRWLTVYHGYPVGSGQPLAYAVEGTRGGKVEGWVGGRTPAPTTMPPFGDRAPWPADPAAPSCRPSDLEVSFGGQDAALGSRQAWLRARNLGRRACAIEGVPDVAFLNAAGARQTEVMVKPYEPSMVPERVVVPPAQSVMAVIDWQAMSTANDPDVTTELLVAAIPGSTPTTLGVAVIDGPSDLDILDGAEVRISPWAQGTSG